MSLITVGDAIQRVQSLYSRGVHSDDTRLTSRHIYSALVTARAVLIRQRAEKQQLSQWMYQSIPCVELIDSPKHECPCIPTNGCSVLRTKYKLPKPVTGLSDVLIQSVTTLDGNITLDPSTFETEKYAGGNKFTAKKPTYYIRNEYLYITIYKKLQVITLSGIFEDPIDAQLYPSFCPSDCPECECKSPFDSPFPIDGDLIRPLLQVANDELIIMLKQMGEDKSNNASDDTNTNGLVHQPQQPGE